MDRFRRADHGPNYWRLSVLQKLRNVRHQPFTEVRRMSIPDTGPEEQEQIEHWQFGCWQDAADYLPPIGQRVVASDGKEIWLDMRHEFAPTLGCGSKKALYWLPFESLAGFLTERKRQELAAKRAAEEPDVIF
jgi:hypothetical protein